MKTIKSFLAVVALLASVVSAQATDSSATGTGTFLAPVGVTEMNQFSFAITRKAGMIQPATLLYANDANWVVRYDSNPYDAQVPGCYRVTGEPGKNVIPLVTMPVALTDGTYTIDMDTTGTSKFEGSYAEADCASAVAGVYSQANIDGSTPIVIPPSGTMFFAYRMNTMTQLKINTDQSHTVTASGTANVSYQ